MGITGTFLFVCAEREDVAARIPTPVRQFFERSGMALVNQEPLHFAVWQNDPHLVGIAISPPMFWDIRTRSGRTPWVLVADS